MFIMMNAARYAVGVQGIAVAERAYQKATQYARDRVQSRPVDGSIKDAAPIIHHPDVRRMLMTMRAYTEGCRAMASVAASAYDASHHHPDASTRQQNLAFYEFLVPLVKGFSTEMSLEVTSLGVQVHGGMGFIEETGAAQYYRDAKILTIYEGTTAIQANDLVGRKTSRDGGNTAKAIAAQIANTESELKKQNSAHALAVAKKLGAACQAFEEVVDFIVANTSSNPNAAFAGSACSPPAAWTPRSSCACAARARGRSPSASISIVPSLVRHEPRPALKFESSSSTTVAASAASIAEPPPCMTRSPSAAARASPSRIGWSAVSMFRSASVSSIRRMNWPPRCRAKSQLNSAVRTPPMWR
jgi:hypothetical protein